MTNRHRPAVPYLCPLFPLNRVERINRTVSDVRQHELLGARTFRDTAAVLLDTTDTAIEAEVREFALRRELIGLGNDISARAATVAVDENAEDQIKAAEQTLYKLGEQGVAERGFQSFLQAVTGALNTANAAFQRGGKLSGISTGLIDLDAKLGGLNKSDLLILAGPITAIPLMLFARASRSVDMATVGLIGYLNPTLQFLCAVLLFGEAFTRWHAIAYAMIWSALALYTLSAFRAVHARNRDLRAGFGG